MLTPETRSTSTPRVQAHRRRERRGLHRRVVTLTRADLAQLELRGYLDADLRGNRIDDG
jgi:hypothetical protein